MASGNCSIELSVPGAMDYLHDIGDHPVALSMLVICTTITVLQVALLIESACFLEKKMRPSAVANHRVTTWWMMAVLPVMSCVVLPGIYSPVSASFCNLIASLCYSFTMFKFLVILVNYYGGYEPMVYRFSAERFTFPLASTPMTCCFPCLPHKRLTRRSFKWLKIAVLQVAILKPVTSFVAAIVWLDGVYLTNRLEEDEPFVVMNLIAILSSMLAMMGLNMLYMASSSYLERYHVGIKFTFIKVGILISNIQPAVLSLLMRFRILGCTFPYTNHARANVLQCALFIVEAGILFPFVRKYYRRLKGNVVGHTPSVLSHIINDPPTGITPRAYAPRASIVSITVDGRERAMTVLGSGDVNIDFISVDLSSMTTVYEEENEEDARLPWPPGERKWVLPQIFTEHVMNSDRSQRRFTIG